MFVWVVILWTNAGHCTEGGEKSEKKSGNFKQFSYYFCLFLNFRTTKLKCPALITCSSSRTEQKFIIKEVSLQHNHEVSDDLFKHYPENRLLTPSLQPLVDLHVRPTLLQHVLQNKTNRPLTKHDNQNAVKKIVASSNKTDIDQLADEIEDILRRDPTARVNVLTDEEGSLHMLYFQTTTMHELLDNLMDATYGTNKLKIPLFVFMVVDGFGISHIAAYCFVSKEQQQVVSGMVKTFVACNPETFNTKCIIVDKDFGEINAVKDNFPAPPSIQLCEFHVQKPFKTAVGNSQASEHGKKVLRTLLSNMLHAKDDNAYLDEKAEYDRIASEDMKSYFATNWDNCKDMWVRYRCDTFLNLGNNTNNRVESYNEKIKGILNNNDKLHTAVRGLVCK